MRQMFDEKQLLIVKDVSDYKDQQEMSNAEALAIIENYPCIKYEGRLYFRQQPYDPEVGVNYYSILNTTNSYSNQLTITFDGDYTIPDQPWIFNAPKSSRITRVSAVNYMHYVTFSDVQFTASSGSLYNATIYVTFCSKDKAAYTTANAISKALFQVAHRNGIGVTIGEPIQATGYTDETEKNIIVSIAGTSNGQSCYLRTIAGTSNNIFETSSQTPFSDYVVPCATMPAK